MKFAVLILTTASPLLAGIVSLGSGAITVSGGNSDSSTPPAYVTNPNAFGFMITDGMSLYSGQQRRNTDPAGGPNTLLDAVGAFDGRRTTISGTINTLTISDSEGGSGGHSQAFAIGLCTRGWRDQAAATYNLNLLTAQPNPGQDGFAGIAIGLKNGSPYLAGYDYDNQANQIFLDLGKAGLASGQSIKAPLVFLIVFTPGVMSVTVNGQMLGSLATSHDFSQALLIAMGASVDPANGAGIMNFTNLQAITPSTPGPPAVLYAISGNLQSALVGATVVQPLVVGLVDAFRNPRAATTVTFSGANATVAPGTVQTDSDGHASATVALGSSPGDVSVTASVPGLPPVIFHLTAIPRVAGPVITAVVNGASFLPAIAAGSWVAILGANLAATTDTANTTAAKLPTSLDNTSVTINGLPAFVYYVSPTQLNVIAPEDPVNGGLDVQVISRGSTSNVFTADKESFAPGLFTFTPRYPSAVHADGTYVGPPNLISGVTSTPAKPGEVILLFGTGFGASNPAVAIGQLTTNSAAPEQPVTATVGGQPAQVRGFLTYAGMYQFNLTIPDLPDGDATISLSIAGSTTQAGLSLSIAQ
jgi:uncharacterized protein (TIGR03437 family)